MPSCFDFTWVLLPYLCRCVGSNECGFRCPTDDICLTEKITLGDPITITISSDTPTRPNRAYNLNNNLNPYTEFDTNINICLLGDEDTQCLYRREFSKRKFGGNSDVVFIGDANFSIECWFYFLEFIIYQLARWNKLLPLVLESKLFSYRFKAPNLSVLNFKRREPFWCKQKIDLATHDKLYTQHPRTCQTSQVIHAASHTSQVIHTASPNLPHITSYTRSIPHITGYIHSIPHISNSQIFADLPLI
jgi:hypothetical protein